MRKILFRAKRIDNGKWVQGSLIQGGVKHRPPNREDISFSNSYIIQKNSPPDVDSWLNGCKCILVSDAIHVIPETICQYTGLTDKNGQKIWENDIVSFVNETEQGKTELKKQVKYRRNGRISPFWWEFECHGCGAYSEIKEVAVLGNIFDNPELLKGGE